MTQIDNQKTCDGEFIMLQLDGNEDDSRDAARKGIHYLPIGFARWSVALMHTMQKVMGREFVL